MSTEVENRIVSMAFDNKNFEQRVSKTMETLDKFNSKLEFKGAEKGFNDISKAADQCDMSGLESTLSSVQMKFSAMQVIGMTAISRITNAAIDAGKMIVSKFWNPIISGGKSRAFKIEDAKFQFRGLGIDVKKAMEAANYAVADTAYGLDAAAKVASQLGASGMEAGEEMATALRGVSGVAAMTNSSYEEIGHIFTQVSGQGRLMADQLNQLSTRGINAAATLGKYLNKTEAEVRDMVSKGKIDFKTFYTAMDEAFGEHAKDANKTFNGAVANIRAALSKIGAEFVAPFIDSEAATKDSAANLIGTANAIREAINAVKAELMAPLNGKGDSFIVKVTNRLLQIVKDLNLYIKSIDYSWLKPFLQGIFNIFTALDKVLVAVGKAIKDIFPRKTAQEATMMATIFAKFTETLILSEDALRTVSAIVKLLLIPFRTLFSLFKVGTAYLIVFIAKVAKLTDKFLSMFSNTKKVNSFFEKIFGKENFETVKENANKVVQAIKDAIEKIKNAFHFDIDTSSIKNAFSDILQKIKPLELVQKVLSGIANGLFKAFEFIVSGIGTLGVSIGKGLDIILEKFRTFDGLSGSLNLLNGGLLALVATNLNYIINNFDKYVKRFSLPVVKINTVLTNIQTTLKHYQASLKADVLMKIAKAIAILAAACIAFSFVDGDKILVATAAMGGLFYMLTKAMKSFNEVFSGLKGLAQMEVLGRTIQTISISILILAGAVAVLSKLDIKDLVTGLIGVGVLLLELSVACKYLSKESEKMTKGLGGLIFLAISIRLLTKAVSNLGALDTDQLIKGLIGVGVICVELGIFLNKLEKNKFGVFKGLALIELAAGIKILANAVGILGGISTEGLIQGLISMGVVFTELAAFLRIAGDSKKIVSTALGVTILGGAMLIFSKAIKDIGSLDISQIGKGILAIGLSLAEVAIAVNLLPKNMLSLSAGLLLVSISISSIVKSLSAAGSMEWIEIAKGLVAIGGAVSIVAVGLNTMKTTLPGAAALIVAAGAIAILTPAIKGLGSMDLWSIIKAMIALAGTFAILGVGASVLTPLIPSMLALSGAIALFGVAVLGIGTGVLLLATGLTAIGAGGAAAAAGLTLLLTSVVNIIPLIIRAIGEGIIAFADVIIEGAPKILEAVSKILSGILEALGEVIPRVIGLMGVLIVSTLQTLANALPSMIQAGANIIKAILLGLAQELPGIIDAAFVLLISFLSGLADAIDEHMAEILEQAGRIAGAIIKGIVEGILKGLGKVGEAIGGLIGGLKKEVDDQSISKTFEENGKHIVSGLKAGIEDSSENEKLNKSVDKLSSNIVKRFNDELEIHSPSVKMMETGKYIVQGIAEGIKSDMSAEEAAEKKVSNIVAAFKDAMNMQSYEFELKDLEYEIWQLENQRATDNEKFGKAKEYQQRKINESVSDYSTLLAKQKTLEDNGFTDSEEYLSNQVAIAKKKKEILEATETLVSLENEQRDLIREQEKEMDELYSEARDLEYNRWELTHKNATTREKYDKQEELTKKKLNDQEKEYNRLVDSANELLQQGVDINSSEYLTSLNKVNEQYNTMLETAQSLNDLSKQREEDARSEAETLKEARKAYYDYMASDYVQDSIKNGPSWMGKTEEERFSYLDKYAREINKLDENLQFVIEEKPAEAYINESGLNKLMGSEIPMEVNLEIHPDVIRHNALEKAGFNENQIIDITYVKSTVSNTVSNAVSSGMVSGVEEGADKADEELTKNKTTQKVYKKLFEDKDDTAKNSATSAIEGFVNTFNSGLGDMENSGLSGALAVLEGLTGKDGLDVNSPSKATKKVGGSVIEGLLDGMKENENELYNYANAMANKIKNILNNSIAIDTSGTVSTPSSTYSSSYNPVIRPVVDMDDLEKGISDANKLLNTTLSVVPFGNSIKTAAKAASEISKTKSQNEAILSQGKGPVSTPSTVNFNQTINSPQAPSRLDLYRDGKALLGQIKTIMNKK